MKKTPEDKRIGYMAVCAIVVIVVAVVVNLIVTRIVYGIAGNPFMPDGIPDLRFR